MPTWDLIQTFEPLSVSVCEEGCQKGSPPSFFHDFEIEVVLTKPMKCEFVVWIGNRGAHTSQFVHDLGKTYTLHVQVPVLEPLADEIHIDLKRAKVWPRFLTRATYPLPWYLTRHK